MSRVSKSSSSSCCIVHEFYRSASRNPSKIAVVHAHGGAKIAGEYIQICGDGNRNSDNVFEELEKKTISSHPPVYEGDEFFTFSEIMDAVESLSFRIRNILDGGDDPNLIRPALGNHNKQSFRHNTSVSVKSAPGSVEFPAVKQVAYTPRIVGLYMEPSVEYIIAVLSILRCGEVFMPLDPSWPNERISSVVASSKSDLIIKNVYRGDGRSFHQLDKADCLIEYIKCPLLPITMQDNLNCRFGSSTVPWPCDNERSRQFCYLMYTSGSTGKPKAVCGTEQGLLNRMLWMQELYPLCGEEILLFKTSISFIDHFQEFLAALLTSCTLVIAPFQGLKDSPFAVVNYLKLYSVARLVAVPSLIRMILPTLQSQHIISIQDSLKLLVLSGEILHLWLWKKLSEFLPKTTILNLYGSTEVTGDCTYFDCKTLPLILESEELSSVPIGVPISECEVSLIGGDTSNEGEICVSGVCVASGYLSDSSNNTLDNTLCEESSFGISTAGQGSRYYFKTGDFARRLVSGDLVFLGRKDRTLKVNGQRISLEEIENTLREHPNVNDAAVIARELYRQGPFLEGYLVTKKDKQNQVLGSSIRSWMVNKVPSAMIPSKFSCIKSLPVSSAGKVDYTLLADSQSSGEKDVQSSELLHLIKKAFCDALMVETVSDNDDFFSKGGDSISAAHASHNIGIDMRLLYTFRSALKLHRALIEQEVLYKPKEIVIAHPEAEMVLRERSTLLPVDSNIIDIDRSGLHKMLSRIDHGKKEEYLPAEGGKMDLFIHPNIHSPKNLDIWTSNSVHIACSFSRGNRLMHRKKYEENRVCKAIWLQEIQSNKSSFLEELWKVQLESCVDASPLLVCRERDIFLYIGSHSRKFLCIDARSGSVRWEVKLEGRVECSAAIIDDFCQVAVGCYKGNIYFINSSDGNVCWTFRTGAEVKSQPIEDKCRHLLWCGSYDHNIYALNYRGYCCVYKLFAGGSIYGSPAIDEVHNKLYVAATSGLMTAISIKTPSWLSAGGAVALGLLVQRVQDEQFSKLWLQDLGAPVFGSLLIDRCYDNVICSLVSGNIVAVNANGSIMWKAKTGGPIFAGPCVSEVLPLQVLICSRDGSVYSFELGTGELLWEHSIKDPIISSAFVDENLQLVSNSSHVSERLMCICGSSGSIHVLRIKLEADEKTNKPCKYVVQEIARLDLQGDIFSSPVMIGGRIFVGCRDDSVHCIGIKEENIVEQ